MKIGVQLPEVERVVRWPEVERMAIAAEDAGLDSLWVGDHYLYRIDGEPRGPWEAWTQLAAIAAVTSRITIAPFVASLGFHEPTVLAKMASTVDDISGGRLVLGVGAGWNDVEYRALGVPFDRRVARFAESFEIVRRLLDGETVSYSGEFYEFSDFVLHPPSARSKRIPLLLGSHGPRMMDIALPHADAWNVWFTHFQNSPDNIPGLLAQFRTACERAGRNPADIEKSVAVLVDFGSEAPRQGSINPIRGTKQQIADVLQRIADAGIDHIQLVLDPIDERTVMLAGDVAALVR